MVNVSLNACPRLKNVVRYVLQYDSPRCIHGEGGGGGRFARGGEVGVIISPISAVDEIISL